MSVIALVAGLVLALASPAAPAGSLPRAGVLAPGKSLGGVRLGDTKARVRARWGGGYRLCSVCRAQTWMYTYPSGRAAGAAVSFRKGRVVAVFTLGAPRGWRTAEGLRMGAASTEVVELYGILAWKRCLGYGASSMRRGRVVTSIYTSGEYVYGFALTRPGEPVCQ